MKQKEIRTERGADRRPPRSETPRSLAASLLLVVLLATMVSPVGGSPMATEAAHLDVSGPATPADRDTLLVAHSIALEMLDTTIEALSGGLAEMNEKQRALFLRFFDPGNTGDVDERFVQQVLENYLKIRRRADRTIRIKFKTESRMCVGERLYYNNLFTVFVCPAFRADHSDTRRARDLVHEVSHIALRALDRPYYDAFKSVAYAELTPWGSPLSRVPVIGPVVREVMRSDTAYHPDAYAWFAGNMRSMGGNSQVDAE